VQRTSTGFDNINPRWSPDGSKIAFISNRTLGESQVNIGGTALWVVSASTGEQRLVSDGTNVKKKYVAQRATVNLSFSDDSGDPGAAARVTVQNSEGRYFGEQRSWMQADDSLDPKRDRSEVHYFTDQGAAVLQLPAGDYSLNVFRGIDHEPLHKDFRLKPSNIAQSITQGTPIEGGSFDLKPLKFNDNSRWLAGDLHVHMNYGGAYRDDPRRLLLQASAEGLGVVENLIVNKEQRFPDILQSSTMQALWPWYESNPLVVNGQEFHTSYWGHLGLLNIKHVIIPGYAGYPNTAAASLVPMDADVADMAHAQNKDALVGWVHPFDELPDPYKDAKLTNELPIDVALGKVDYYEVLGFSDHKSSAAIWYRLLNLGFRLPAGAGTDAMTNFASLRGPVGLNRVYVNVSPGPLKLDEWLRNLKAGKTFATNGPLLRFTLGSQPIGGEVKVAKAGEVPFTAALRSIVPVDKVEVVCDGAVAKTIFPADQRSAATQTKDSQGHAATTSLDVSGTVPIAKSGWCVLRAYSDHAEEPIMDIYPYGTTSPIYVTVAGEKPRSPEDAKFFSKWIERVREDASIHPDYNTPAEREHVLKVLDDAARVYAGMER
jgi:Periplasmic component of the Tol biopolymer transport system